MDDATLISKIGRALWGATWKGQMAEAVRHQKGAVSAWALGRVPVPAGVWSELQELLRERRHEFDDLIPQIQPAHDAALQRTIEQTKRGRRAGGG